MAASKRPRRRDARKTKAELIAELERLRARLNAAECSAPATGYSSGPVCGASEAQLRNLIATMPIAAAMFDRDMRCLAHSPRWRADFRIQDSDVIGRRLCEVLPGIAHHWQEFHRRCVEEGVPHACDDDEVTRADGSQDWVSWSVVPWHHENGSTGGLLLFTELLTERKQAEHALRTEKARLTAIIENSPLAIALKDTEGRCLLVNKRYCELFGVTRESARGKTVHDYTPGTYAEVFAAHEKQVLSSGKPIQRELVNSTPQGERVLLESKFPIVDGSGSIVGLGFIGTDVTEHQAAQERFRRYFNSPLVGTAIYAPNKNWIEVNDKLCDILGYSRDELLGLSWMDITHPDDVAANLELFDKAVAGEHDSYTLDKLFIRGDDTLVHTAIAVQCIRHPDGTPDYFTLMVLDLSDWKRAELEARTARQMLVGAIENMNDGFVLVDEEERLVLCNERFRQIFPRVRDHIVPGVPFDKLIEACRITGQIVGIKAGDRTASGGMKYAEIRADAWRNGKTAELLTSEGRWIETRDYATAGVGRVGIRIDITERKATEAALRQSQGRFQDFAEASADWFWETDAELRFTYLSANVADITGMPPEVIYGLTPGDLIVGWNDHDAKEAHLETLRQRKPFRDFVYCRRSRGKGPIWIRTSGVPMFSEDGDFLGYRGSASDITEEMRAEEALRHSEQRFRDFAEVASDWFWETDESMKCVYLSDRFSEVTGRERAQFIGLDRVTFAAPDPPDERWRAHIADLNAHRPFRDFRYQPPGEPVRHWSVSGTPVFDEDGVFRGYRGTGTDVTEQMQAAKAQQEAIEQAELASRAKSDFLANMSHELRTPLNAIIGFSQIMEQQTFGPIGSPQYREYAADILQSGNHLLSLINDILDLSKIEAGKFDLYEEPVDVAAVTQSCLRLMRPQVEAGQLTIRENVEEPLPPLLADRRAIKQMLFNLLSNAVKFTPAGGTITTSAGIDAEGRMALAVSDTGPGISKKHLPKVLEPFTQIEGPLIREHAGTGLGLALVKAFAQRHGGTLDIDSVPGAGTTVTVLMPAERVLESQVPETASSRAAGSSL